MDLTPPTESGQNSYIAWSQNTLFLLRLIITLAYNRTYGKTLIPIKFSVFFLFTFKDTLGSFHLPLFNVCFQMRQQAVSPGGCIITLAAFVLLVFAVRFQMYAQIACLNGCKVTQVAFV